MVGLMNLRGLKFNIVNTGMLPLLIGIGVDYGVYTVHRWISEGKGLKSIRPTVESTGRAVSLAALTTMIGFGSVILCKWRGLSMMGSTLTMGIGLWLDRGDRIPSGDPQGHRTDQGPEGRGSAIIRRTLIIHSR